MLGFSLGLTIPGPRFGGASIIDRFVFTDQSAGAASIPSGLVFTRASSGFTIRTGSDTVLTSGGFTSNDVGRIGREDSSHELALYLEGPGENRSGYSRSANLHPGAGGSITYTTGRTGPDGTTNAIRGVVLSGSYSKYQDISADNVNGTISAWVKRGSGSGAYQIVGAYAGTTGVAVAGTAGTSWSRVVSNPFPFPAGKTSYLNPWDGRANTTLGSSAGERDVELDLLQWEPRKYASSAIITSGGTTGTRAGEFLILDSTKATRALHNGRIGVYLKFRALANLTSLDENTEGGILYGVGSPTPKFYVWIAPSSRYILLGAGPTTYSMTANNVISISVSDIVEIELEVGNGKSRFWWRINGGVIQAASFTVRNDTVDAIPSLPSGISILSNGSSYHTPAKLLEFSTFVPSKGKL